MYKLFLVVCMCALLYASFKMGSKKLKISKTTSLLIKSNKKEERERQYRLIIKGRLSWFEGIIESNALLLKARNNLARKLMVISYDSEDVCRQKISVKLLLLLVVVIVEAVVLIVLIPSWYVVASVCGVTAFMYYTNLKGSMEKRVQKLYLQLPEALQCFLDSYIVTANVKASLDSVPHNMKGDICVVFEKLSRKLSSGEDAKESIDAFAEDLDYFWAYAFAELLGIALTSSGDIKSDVQFLITIINDSIESSMETKAQLNGSKNIVNGLNLCALIGLLAEFMFLPFARGLYLYTSTGNLVILLFVLEVVGSNIAFTLMEDF